ncbi:hypothetical protein [Bacillus sp. AFS053548]|uniref:hypothetical protein n=1 Tax=Bacillus sp. AFS053548 TaxID=2033505 RepID=UPI000BFB3BD3|nr:hypothetical protein [Bacillus sp. AFS053548]PGM57002.1 hypothetical protein CN946_08620 [Bacillus sp. AFS053548]
MNMIIKITLSSTIALFVVGVIYSTITPNRVIISNAEYEFDINKKENITEAAKQLFVGRVVEQLDTESDEGGPYTPYKVVIENNLKGELEANQEVIVEQRIGYERSHKAIRKMEVDDDFLTTANTYVFGTSNVKNKERFRIIVPLKGNVKIKGKNDRFPNEEILKDFKDALEKRIMINASLNLGFFSPKDFQGSLYLIKNSSNASFINSFG